MTEWTEPHRWVSRERITKEKLNTLTDAILWLKENIGGGPGAVTFLDLTDTPDSYSGQGGKVVAVKATEDGLEFVTGVHDRTYHRSPTLPEGDVHLTAVPIDHPDGSVTRAKLSGVFPIQTGDLADGSVTPVKLKATNTPSDGQLPSYNQATGNFTWVNVRAGPVPEGRRPGYFSLPGVVSVSLTTWTVSANTLIFSPIWVNCAIRVDRIVQTVTTAGASGTKGRVGIYRGDKDYNIGELVVDAGEFPVDTTGAKTLTVDVILEPGIYFLCFLTSGTPGMRRVTGGYNMYLPEFPATPFVNYLYASYTYGPLPSTGPSTLSHYNSTAPGWYYNSLLRIAEYL